MYLYGASGHGKVICEIAESLNRGVLGFIDDNASGSADLLGYPVLNKLPDSDAALILSIGNNRVRKQIAEHLYHAEFATLVHPKSNISARSTLGKGTVVMAGVSVNSNTSVGQHSILNTNCSVDHDCILGDYVHISPNAVLAGNVSVGEGTHIGIGSAVIQGVKIGTWCTIGAGAVIIRDVPDYAVVVGNPGRVINK